MSDDLDDSLSECRICYTYWIGEGSFDAAWDHMRETHHGVQMTGAI